MQFETWNEASFGQFVVLALTTPPPLHDTVKVKLHQFVDWLLHEIEQGRRPAVLNDLPLQRIRKCMTLVRSYDSLTEEEFTRIYSQLK